MDELIRTHGRREPLQKEIAFLPIILGRNGLTEEQRERLLDVVVSLEESQEPIPPHGMVAVVGFNPCNEDFQALATVCKAQKLKLVIPPEGTPGTSTFEL